MSDSLAGAPEIRHLRDDERPQELDLRTYGFEDYPATEGSPKDLERLEPAEIIGAFEDGRLRAAAQAYRFRFFLRGALRPMGGVAAVAAYPEARRRGLVRRVMEASLRELADEGIALSMLHPFKVSFYARLGYAPVDDSLVVEYPVTAFTDYLADRDAASLVTTRTSPAVSPGAAGAGSDKPGEEWIRAWRAYTRFADEVTVGSHGPVCLESVPESQVRSRWSDKSIVLMRDPATSTIEAGLVMRKEGSEPDGHLRIASYRARPGRLPAILRFIALHADQCARVCMHLAPMSETGRLFAWTGDVPADVQIQGLRRPWMVRILRVTDALHGLPVAGADGTVVLEVEDPILPENSGGYALRASGGLLGVEPAGAATAQIRLGIDELSALVAGAAGPPAAEAGAAGAEPTSAAGVLASWFPPRLLWNDWFF